MQTLKLTNEEVEVLREILQHSMSEMDIEIFRTDTHDFKVMLQRRREIIDGILERIAHVPAAF
ncbi:MAG TPA: hypothetical protein VEC99_13820 [Clostridia bacterium]|nr:hypothetical protein [Clostridia bacterium]